jgi:hypothetical protein
MSKNLRLFTILAVIALVVAVIRYFLKGLLRPLGVSDFAGSFLASITLFTLLGLIIIFTREGLTAGGTYWRAAAWFTAFALWCQGLIIGGILITAKTGTPTYYDEMMGKHLSLPPLIHAFQHGIASIIVAIIGLVLGAPVYFVAKRGRPGSVPAAK